MGTACKGSIEGGEAPHSPFDAVLDPLSQGTSSSCGSPQWSLGSHLHRKLSIWASGLQVGEAMGTPIPSPPPGRGIPCCSLSLYLATRDTGTNTGCGIRGNVPVGIACQFSRPLCPIPKLLEPQLLAFFLWHPALLALVPRTPLFISRQSNQGVLPCFRVLPDPFRAPPPSQAEQRLSPCTSLDLGSGPVLAQLSTQCQWTGQELCF